MLFKFKNDKEDKNPLDMKRISIGGFEQAARSAMFVGGGSIEAIAIDTAAGLIIDQTKEVVENRSKVVGPKNS